MTQQDKWKKRPAVQRYRSFCDLVRLHRPKDFEFPAAGAHVTFFVPMPKSWTKTKKKQMESEPHQVRPDVDNYLKGLLDALCDEDNYIYDVRVTKLYTRQGKGCIVIKYDE